MNKKMIVACVLASSFFSTSAFSKTLSLKEVKSHIGKCLPSGYHNIIYKIVQAESNKRPFAINVNKKMKISRQPTNIYEAIDIVRRLDDVNASYDIGLTQINSQHFKPNRIFSSKGYIPEDALDICTNLKMSALILEDAFVRTKDLKKALSVYNTGNPKSGFKNGYVDRVLSKSNF